MTEQITETVADIRAFHRVYLPFFHLLSQKYLNSDYSMAEARILYELYHYRGITASGIAARLYIDKGYLSRILKRFESRGCLRKTVSQVDSRQAVLSLTPEGEKLARRLMGESDQQVKQQLAGISDGDLARLSYHLNEIIQILGGDKHDGHSV